MNYYKKFDSQAGLTLIELIVTIVVISVAVSGSLLAIQFTTRHSADPMIRQQVVAIADAYMEEILLHKYEDPDRVDVFDYNGTREAPTDQTGDEIEGLENYWVTVNVTNATNALGPSGNKLQQAAKITVTVSHNSTDAQFDLVGYKAKY